jgi:hypothetical protein
MTTGNAGRFRTVGNHPGHDQKSHGRKRSGGDGATGQAALDAVPLGLGGSPGLSDSEALALIAYRRPDHFRQINGAHREGRRPDGEEGKIADQMDSAMARSQTEVDTVVFRGMHGLDGYPAMFGERMASDMTGLEWREDAVTSTSVRQSSANEFAAGGLLMRISVPKGTGALKMQSGEWDGEGEVVLERGLRMRVTQDHGIDPDWTHRVLDVEVVAE